MSDKTKRHYSSSGQLHRIDGPALECENGTKYWCQNGQLHRLDGPAYEGADGQNIWFIRGEKMTQEIHAKRLAALSLPPLLNKVVVIDGFKYILG
ncbi:MAG: hypothetical protein EKK57_05005 [Proteobacteria bacterium]|nr:MAG: hypothetical protein EKK57_05005 [Pseudomonadota bacterium]